jgi:hypothetical protein
MVMVIPGVRDSLPTNAVGRLDRLLRGETLCDEDMQLLEGERGLWDPQESRDKGLQGLGPVGQNSSQALMRQGVCQRDPKIPGSVEVLLDFLKALFSVVVDIY